MPATSQIPPRAREGDAKAFSELVRRYENKIFRLAMHITQNREDAEDVLQETFLKAYEHLDQFQGNSKFYTWIVRIAVNQALMKLRKRKTDKTVSMDETIDTGEDTVAREIAAWDENPEQRYSREEMNQILTPPWIAWRRPIARFSCCGISKSFPPKKPPRRWICPSRRSRAGCCARACNSAIS
jgi:RNA polymerase sigma factor (sigma-70 family)